MKGMVYMAISAASYSLNAFFLKILYLNSSITAYEVSYQLNILIIVLNFAWMKLVERDPFQVPQGLRYTLIMRSFTGFLGTTGFYLAI
mmetsp:Transcript_12887/g.12780  ORF Transcript_12887/g.12780 Transcript_12887/m.12780 type:complete len:88 (+) Transcript_12887:146-409(+)